MSLLPPLSPPKFNWNVGTSLPSNVIRRPLASLRPGYSYSISMIESCSTGVESFKVIITCCLSAGLTATDSTVWDFVAFELAASSLPL